MKTKLSPLVIVVAFIILLAGAFFVENARAGQPHMDAALDALRTARAELNAAERDKGGHRTRAVELIDRAIEQVKMGIDAGA